MTRAKTSHAFIATTCSSPRTYASFGREHLDSLCIVREREEENEERSNIYIPPQSTHGLLTSISRAIDTRAVLICVMMIIIFITGFVVLRHVRKFFSLNVSLRNKRTQRGAWGCLRASFRLSRNIDPFAINFIEV
jgi:hypothetical protein